MNGPTMRLRMEGRARRTSNPSPRSRVRGRITVSIGEAGSRSANGSSGMFQLIRGPLQSRARAAQLAFGHALVIHPRLHVRGLALGAQLLGEVLAVSSDVFLRKGHRHTSAT